ncbi:MAG: hypothetical protein ABIP35_14905 [Ginsengibacter sp.]
METARKILPIVRKVSFAEAEEADDEFWAQATAEERLKELVELRKLVFGNADIKIRKIVSRRSLYDDEN